MPSIAVAYLCRKGNPPRLAKAFLQSLLRHSAGTEYTLYYLLKGFAPGETDDVLERFERQLPCKVKKLYVSDEFFMINALFDAAEEITETLYLPLGSASMILADNWLKYLLTAYESFPDCGAVGATGSHEMLNHTTPFPNTHIRTTGFLMNRKEFLAIERGPLRTKYDNNLFEAGPNGMTQQLLNAGKSVAVVDRHGKTYLPEDWQKSRTFRANQQENLLIADNRTHDYQKSLMRKRRKLARLAWHNLHDVGKSSIINWIGCRLRKFI